MTRFLLHRCCHQPSSLISKPRRCCDRRRQTSNFTTFSFPLIVVAILTTQHQAYIHYCNNYGAQAWATRPQSRTSLRNSLSQSSASGDRIKKHSHSNFQLTQYKFFRTGTDEDSDDTTTTSVQRTEYTIDNIVCAPTRPDKLESAVAKACKSLNLYLEKKPIAKHTQQAFDSVVDLIESSNHPTTLQTKTSKIVLDSGCGTGRSSLLLGEMYPDHLIIGVDRSFVRLSKQTSNDDDDDVSDDDEEQSPSYVSSSRRPICELMSDNVILIRAELVDFWRLCDQKQKQGEWNIAKHYMLYPNPYPKQLRLTQRWYAHPSFPLILKLSAQEIVIRSNWENYLQEFATSIQIANEYYSTSVEEQETPAVVVNYAEPYLSSASKGPLPRTDKSIAMTNFERKYDACGESTYELKLVAE